MKRIDLKKDFHDLITPSSKEPEIVRVPKLRYLMIDGTGDPNSSPEFTEAVQALYALAYTIKFTIKKEHALDYPVMALEGLWWADDMAAYLMQNREAWKWTLMIMQPDVVTKQYVKKVAQLVYAKKKLEKVREVRLAQYAEGVAVQIMHVGPYATEGPTISTLHAFAAQRGFELSGKHHEIYLSDPKRVKPHKMKTILRQPVKRRR